MVHNDERLPLEDLYRGLRRMAASDPKSARARLLELMNTERETFEEVLDLMRSSSEGRLRQLVANTAHARRDDANIRDLLIPHLLEWQRFESDEFAKAAISAAIQGLDPAFYSKLPSAKDARLTARTSATNPLCTEESVEIYRWVARRLCHRVRNRMDLPVAYLVEAIHEASSIGSNATRTAVMRLLVEVQQSLKQVGRVVEFNIEDEHFQWRSFAIVPWLRKMTDRFRSGSSSLRLEISGDDRHEIEGTELLLEIIFWNLWQNIPQEDGEECVAKVVVSAKNSELCILVSDSGPGFQPCQASEAFKTPLSTRGEERGRGLLEVADAVQRLRGSAQIVSVAGEYRIELSFPIAKPSREIP